ncbi:30S ribosomal protein S8, partial [Clostridioides difficile]|uniref:30S ribosomal protein S8 n=1 Tax=Clostridioides difficile TaxID=1496 RepID=UPI000BB35A92
MTMTDQIADMLTRIRNANVVKHETVDVLASNMKKDLARTLLEEGFIRGYDVIEDGKHGVIRIKLKYG